MAETVVKLPEWLKFGVEVCVLVKKYRSEFNEYGDETEVEDGEEEKYGYVYGMGALQRAWVNVMMWDGKQMNASLDQVEPVYQKGRRGISAPWQPVEGEPVAHWQKGWSTVVLAIHQYEGWANVARIPESFDPKNPDHYKVTWWEANAEIWKP